VAPQIVRAAELFVDKKPGRIVARNYRLPLHRKPLPADDVIDFRALTHLNPLRIDDAKIQPGRGNAGQISGILKEAEDLTQGNGSDQGTGEPISHIAWMFQDLQNVLNVFAWRLKEFFAAVGFEKLHDFADLLGSRAIRNQQRIRRVHHDQILHTKKRYQLIPAIDIVAGGVRA